MSPAKVLALLPFLIVTDGAAAEIQIPSTDPNWRIELVAEAPKIKHPSVVCSAPDGRVFVAEDPMDITAPADSALGRILCFHPDGRVTVFAEKLHAVFGMQYLEGKLYVLHNPKFSVFDDDQGVGKNRFELIESTNPNPWALDWNDHVPANFRLAMDGYLYMAVGDKGIFGAVGRDGKRVDLRGGGILRLRPDGTALEVYCTGVRNILDVAMNDEDEFFTYDNTDEQQWMGRVTHMADGGFYGYPYHFIPRRPYTLWMLADYGGGAATGALCYNEDALPSEYWGNLFLADFGKRQVMRVRVERDGGSYRAIEKTDLFPEPPADFRPVGIAWSADGTSIYLCDWQHRDTKGEAVVGRLWKMTYTGTTRAAPKPKWFLPAAMGEKCDASNAELLEALDHPSHSVRLTAQRRLAERGPSAAPALGRMIADLQAPARARWHAIWALDALDGGEAARKDILAAAADTHPGVRRQAIRQLGTRRVNDAAPVLLGRLRDADPSVRFQAATALGRIGNSIALRPLIEACKETDLFARYAAFNALNRLGRAHPATWVEIAKGLEHRDAVVREGVMFALRDTYDATLVDVLSLVAAPSPRAATGAVSPSDQARATAVELLAPLHRTLPEWKGEWWAYHPVNSPPPVKSREWAGTRKVLDALRASLGDASLPVRRAAIESVLETKDLEAAPKLRELFQHETNSGLRPLIVSALGAARDPEAKGLVAAILTNAVNEPALVHEALRAAAHLGGPELESAVLRVLESGHPSPAILREALGTIGQLEPAGSAATSTLARYAKHSQEEVRSAAVDVILKIRRDAALEIILPLLEHEMAGVRRTAVSAAGRLNTPEAVPKLMKAFEDPETRREAIIALARTPELPALDAYLAGLADDSPATRESCRKAIRKIGAEALKAIEARLNTLSPTVLAELRRAYDDDPDAKKILQGVEQPPEPEDYMEFALKHEGDIGRGKKLFLNPSGVACVKCHIVGADGGRIGPDLTTAGAQFSRRELAESIVFPSKAVREGYQAAIVETRDGDELSGLYKGETADELNLMDGEGRLHQIRKTDITSRRLGTLSLMPEGLHVVLSLQDFTDLVSFLESLKTVPQP